MNPITVVQLVPRMDSGGAETSTLEIAAALVAAGHRCVVIAAQGSRSAQLQGIGCEYRELDLASKSPLALLRALTLRRWLQDIRPDIIHVRSRLPAWIAAMAIRGLNPRPLSVSTLHGLNSVSRYSAIMTRADALIAVSECARDYWLENYPQLDAQRLVVIARGIDPQRFHPAVQVSSEWRTALWQQHPGLRQRRLLCLPGRGSRLKGHSDAIMLLRGLCDQGVDAALWLPGCVQAGRDSYLRELEALASRQGVLDRLALSAARDDMPQVLAASDLVLQLSRSPESFGRTVIEALAVGTPVLGWQHGGVGEILARDYPCGGVPRGEHPLLIARAMQLLESAAPPPDMSGYSLHAMQQATLALYARLLQARRTNNR